MNLARLERSYGGLRAARAGAWESSLHCCQHLTASAIAHVPLSSEKRQRFSGGYIALLRIGDSIMTYMYPVFR